MKHRLVMTAAFAVSICGLGRAATAATITFDDVANGTVINELYGGVTFTTLFGGVDGGDVYARTDPTNTSDNVVSIFETGLPPFNNRFGTIHAAFDVAQAQVSIDALLVAGLEGFGNTGVAYMKVYDSQLALLGEVVSGPTLQTWQTLSYSGSDIRHVYFTVSDPQYPTYAYFDNFSYGGGSNGVPDPASTLLLLMTSLGGIGFVRLKWLT